MNETPLPLALFDAVLRGVLLALLSPLPPGMTGLAGELPNDPPGFDRAVLPEVDRAIAAFFGRHLLPLKAMPTAATPAPGA